jgi:hypothetical protein
MLDHRRHFPGLISPAFMLVIILLCLPQFTAAAPGFPNFRDLKVYTFSEPDAKNPAKILVRTQLVNEGNTAVRIGARLNSSRALKISGGKFDNSIPAGKSVDWTWSFLAPEGFTHEILTGSIDINGRRERDLYITVQGADPPDFDGRFVEKVTERARAVATYAPRTRESIRAEMKALEARKPQPVLTLAAAGKTDYAIVADPLFIPPAEGEGPDSWRQTGLTGMQQYLAVAIGDLQRGIELQSGAVLPIRAKATGPAIIIRLADPGVEATGLQDAYRLRTDGANVIIEAKTPEGARNGICGLLTDYLDCHWFMPKELGEEIIIPRDRTVRLPALNEVRGSPWLSAGGASWGVPPAWNMRNRAIVNRGRMSFGHSWEGYINNSLYPFDKFPEYYARDREGRRRSNNFCSTHPEVIDIVAKKVNTYFANDPNAIVASLDPNDYAAMCLCDRCLALDKHYGQNREDGREVADRLLHFSKEIYDRLEPRFKDRFLGILVYGFQMDLPKSAKGHPRHAGMICNMTWEYDHSRPFNDPTSKRNQVFYHLVEGWGSAIQQLGYYDYYGHFFFFGPWGMVQKMREDLPVLHELGGTFIMLEAQPIFAAQGLNHYIADRLLWDLEADVDLLMEEFFTKFYGPAAEPMREYWLAIERIYATQRVGYDPLFRVGENPATWTELDGYLAKARQIAANLPAEQKRFADRVTLASEGLEYGRLRYAYDSHYWVIAHANLGRTVDHAAGIEYLRQYGARLEELQQKYTMDDPYWPPLIASYFLLNSAAEIKRHEDALAQQSGY